jgi:hypothetical protein
MANSVQILDKIERNCRQLGISVTRNSASLLTAAGMEITYVAATIQSPMGGVSDASAPFLGIGIANPGKIDIDTDPANLAQFQVLRVVCGHANNITIPAGELQGQADLLGMGQ